MSNAIDFSDPPHLWMRLLPDGPLYLALAGSLPHSALGEKLRRAEVDQIIRSGKVTLAMLDAAGFGPLEQGHVFHLTLLARNLVEAGCLRLAAATAPGQGALLTTMLAGLPGKTNPRAQAACFDQLQAANRWLFSSEPAPSLPPSQADTERASVAATHPGPGTNPTPPSASGPQPSSAPGSEPPTHTRPGAAPASGFGAPPGPPPGIAYPSPSTLPTNPSAAATRPSAQPLNITSAQATLLPLLLDGSPEAARFFHGRPLLPSLAGKLEHLPLVSVASGTGPRRFGLLRSPDTREDVFDELMAEAIFNLERQEIPIEERSAAGQRFVRSLSPLAAEGILSPKFLGKIQDTLRSRALAVAIPMRGALLATQVNAENGAMLQGLAGMAKDLFSGAQALSPHLFLVEGGKVVGPLRLETGAPAEPKTQPAVVPVTLKVLPARTVTEAHLYMDLRGAEPGQRGHRMVEMAGDLVSLFEVRCGGDAAPTRFAFKIENAAAPPGVIGGARPSQIIAPDEFMVRADVLSKRVPASPEGLDAEQRRRARTMLETAANCLIEATKFIPPGAERVPEERMALRDRWEHLQITPGRFDRGRLEIVAKTYNNIAAKF